MKKIFIVSVIFLFSTIINAQQSKELSQEEIAKVLAYAVKEKCSDESVLKVLSLKINTTGYKTYDPNSNGFTLKISASLDKKSIVSIATEIARVYVDHEGNFDGCKKNDVKVDEGEHHKLVQVPYVLTTDTYIFSKSKTRWAYNEICKDEFGDIAKSATYGDFNNFDKLYSDFELRLEHLNIPNYKDGDSGVDKILIGDSDLYSIYYRDSKANALKKELYIKSEEKNIAKGRLVCKIPKDKK